MMDLESRLRDKRDRWIQESVKWEKREYRIAQRKDMFKHVVLSVSSVLKPAFRASLIGTFIVSAGMYVLTMGPTIYSQVIEPASTAIYEGLHDRYVVADLKTDKYPELGVFPPKRTYGGIPFDMGWTQTGDYIYEGEYSGFEPVQDPWAVHFIIWAYHNDRDDNVGYIELDFESGATLREELIRGYNIRDAYHSDFSHSDRYYMTDTVLSADNAHEVDRQYDEQGNLVGRLDMLTIEIPDDPAYSILTDIKLESYRNHKGLFTTFFVGGITIERDIGQY